MSLIIKNRYFKFTNNFGNIQNLLEYIVTNDIADKFILLLPTGKLVRYYQNKFIQLYYSKNNRPTVLPQFYTLEGFAMSCFTKLFEKNKYRVISEAYKISMIEEAMLEANLEFFKPKSGKISFSLVSKLASLIFGLKEDGISPNDLLRDLSIVDNEEILHPERLTDIYRIYNKYTELLGDGLIDKNDVINMLTAELAKGFDYDENMNPIINSEHKETAKIFDKLFLGIEQIFLFGFSDFKMPEAKFLSTFSAANTPLGILFDYSYYNGPLFGKYAEIMEVFRKTGFEIENIYDDIEKEINSPEDELNLPNSMYLRRLLFNVEKGIKKTTFSEMLSILVADNKHDEINSIAKLIKYLNIEKGFKLSDICVVMRSPDKYSTALRETFAKYLIPANVSDRFSLANSGLINTIFALINVWQKNFRFKDVVKALSNPSFELTYTVKSAQGEDKTEKIDVDNLINTARMLRIRGGNYQDAQYWIKRFEFSIKFYKDYLSNPNIVKEDLDEVEIKKNILNFNKALRDFKAFLAKFPKMNAGMKNSDNSTKLLPAEFAQFIKENFIKNFNFAERIREEFSILHKVKSKYSEVEYEILVEHIEQQGRALSVFIDLINEMTFILSDRHKAVKFDFAELFKRLHTAVGASKYNTTEKYNRGVTITAIEQIRGLDFKVSILCGAIDGEFPLKYRVESLLGKETKGSDENHLKAESMLFYQFLSGSAELLDSQNKIMYITYPAKEQTEQLVRSHFIEELLKITTIQEDERIIVLNDARKSNHPDYKWLNSAASEAEIYQKAAKYLFNKQELSEYIENIINQQSNEYQNFEYLKILSQENFKTFKYELPKLSAQANEFTVSRKDNIFSASNFDTYSECPYKYYAQHFLKLDSNSPPDLLLTPLERGTFLHAVFYKFFNRIQELQLSKIPQEKRTLDDYIVRLYSAKRDEYLDYINQIAEDEIARLEYEHPLFQLERDYLIGNGIRYGIVQQFLVNLIQNKEKSDFQAVFFETSFGFGKTDANSIPFVNIQIDENRSFKLRGKIDRIEIARLEDDNYAIAVADYKTTQNSFPSANDVKNSKKFQIPLYLEAARQFLQKKFEIESIPYEGIYYAFDPRVEKDGKESEIKSSTIYHKEKDLIDIKELTATGLDDDDVQIFLAKSYKKAYDIVDNISTGEFEPTPSAKSCMYCNFYSVCRSRII
jgi:ATP-dependent helicase/DNAse subunit B